MSRLEYLDILEKKLKKVMSEKETNDIIRDYAEYFEEGKAQGKGDDEIAAKLGNPEEIAKQILEENGYDAKKAHTNVKNMINDMGEKAKTSKVGGVFAKIIKFILIFTIVICLIPFAFAVLGVLAAIALAIISFFVAIIMSGIAGLIAVLAGLICTGVVVSLLNPFIIATIFMGLLAIIAFSLLLISLGVLGTVGLFNLIKRLFFLICKAVNKSFESKEAKSNEKTI